MTIEDLNIFVTVAQTLNFTQAAEHLHSSQPTLSRRISELEKELGYELLSRTTRKVELTEFGRYFLIESRRLLNNYNQFLNQLNSLSSQNFGSLTIGTPALMTQSFLPMVIRSFNKKYLGVSLEIKMIEPGRCVEMLKNRTIDLGFLASTDLDGIPSYLSMKSVSVGNLALMTSVTHRLAGHSIVTAEELAGERIYIPRRLNTPFLWNTISYYLIQHNIPTDAMVEVENPDVMTMMVEAGLGVTFMASNLVAELSNAKRFKLVKVDGLVASTHLVVVWNKNTMSLSRDRFLNEIFEVKESIP